MKITGIIFLAIQIFSTFILAENKMVQNISLESFTSVPNADKFDISINYFNSSSSEWYDSDGNVLKDGEKSYIKNGAGEIIGVDRFNLKYSQTVLNLQIEYFNQKNSGVYLYIPLLLNSQINATDMFKSNSADIVGGLYFIWDPFFPIQRIKTDLFFKKANNYLPTNSVAQYFGSGLYQIGGSFALDLQLSKRSVFSNKLTFTNTPITKIIRKIISDTLNIGPTNHLDFQSRLIKGFTKRIALGIDFEYHNFNSKSIRMSGSDNYNKIDGYFFMLKPILGLRLISEQQLGYINIDHVDLMCGYAISLKSRNSYKPQILHFGLNFNFE